VARFDPKIYCRISVGVGYLGFIVERIQRGLLLTLHPFQSLIERAAIDVVQFLANVAESGAGIDPVAGHGEVSLPDARAQRVIVECSGRVPALKTPSLLSFFSRTQWL
jgi:hypothetical protein